MTSLALRKSFRLLTVLVAICVFQVYVLADAMRPSVATNVATTNYGLNASMLGRLTIGEHQSVLVNGNSASSGTTIFSGSELQTAGDVEASVQLGTAGKLFIQPGSTLTVNFDKESIDVKLSAGDAFVTANAGVKSSITTPDGKTSLTIGGEPGAQPAPAPGWSTWSHGTRTAVVVVVIGGIIFTIVCIAKCGGNDSPRR
jgi:hypothetical protein